MTVHEHLLEIGACEPAIEWASQFTTAQEVWDKCERVDWLLWWCGHTGDNLQSIRKVARSIADSVQYLRTGRAAYTAADAAYTAAAYAAADAAYAARKDQNQLNMAICRKWLVCPWHEE